MYFPVHFVSCPHTCSILSLPVDDLYRLACDRLGSRIVEHVVGAKNLLLPQQKKYLVKRMRGCFIDVRMWLCFDMICLVSSLECLVSPSCRHSDFAILLPFSLNVSQLALERFGGYCVEKLYHAVDLEHKRLIMEELAFGIHRLSSTVAGKFLLHSLKVEDFKHRTGEWAQKRATSDKVRREFADILGDDEPQQKQQQEPPSQKKSQHPQKQQQAPAKQPAQPQHGKHASHSEPAAEARASKKAKHSHVAAVAPAPAPSDRDELDDLFDGMSQPPKADKAKSAKKHGGADPGDAHASSSKGKKRTLP